MDHEPANLQLIESEAPTLCKISSISRSRYFNPDMLINTAMERENQDAVLRLPNTIGVFDGLGSYHGGRVASQIARNYVGEKLPQIQEGLNATQIKEQLTSLLQDANHAILKEAKGEYKDMGTTATICYVRDGIAYIAHIGDSRAYLVRDGVLTQITLDDGNIILETNGDIPQAYQLQKSLSNALNVQDLNPEELAIFKSRNMLLQSLGSNKVRPRIHEQSLHPGDVILLTTDGIHDNVTDRHMEDIMQRNPDLDKARDQLIKTAYNISKQGGFRSKEDDKTVALLQYNPPK